MMNATSTTDQLNSSQKIRSGFRTIVERVVMVAVDEEEPPDDDEEDDEEVAEEEPADDDDDDEALPAPVMGIE
jgi:hypothetical protein